MVRELCGHHGERLGERRAIHSATGSHGWPRGSGGRHGSAACAEWPPRHSDQPHVSIDVENVTAREA